MNTDRALTNPVAKYLPCQWCGDAGEKARAVVVDDQGEEHGEAVEFITCRPCLKRFTEEELGWPKT